MEQIAKIVDVYPTLILKRDELLAAGYDDVDHSHLYIEGRRFTRTIYRPPTGPDLLLAQSKGDPTYTYYRRLPISASFSKSSLYHIVLQNEAEITDERLLDDRNSNPGWSWANVADSVSRIIDDNDFFVREPATFGLWAHEAFGTLTILDRGWNHIAPTGPIDEITECSICLANMTHEDSIMLHCQHVFHKDCLFPNLWKDPELKCSICRRNLFL